MQRVNAHRPERRHLYAADQSEWRAWLEKHHASSPGVALVFYKKGTGKPCVTYDQAVEEALCFGWIDSRKNALDAERYTLMFSPRKKGSGWARSNKARVEKLIATGRMTGPGLARIEAARRDGSWTALDAIENPEPPQALVMALARSKPARRHFESLNPSPRRLLLRWIASAKRAETRAERIEATVTAAARGRLPEAFARLLPSARGSSRE
jgi:uncharacterized protein YdeI (YjbR/CyaY-like superfamily)